MMKLFRISAGLALFACLAAAATHIVDGCSPPTLTGTCLNDGVTPKHGAILVTGPNGGSVPPSTQTVTIGTGGAVDFSLVGCPGCKYTAQYNLTNPAGVRTQQFQETWIVPDTTSVLTVKMLWGGSSAPYFLISPNQVSVEGLHPGQMWLFDGSSWVGAYPAQSSNAGTQDPGVNGVMKRISLNTTDVVAGAPGDYVRVDGTSGPPGVPSVAGRTGAIVLTQADITNLVSDLGLKSPLASPVFSGQPTIPDFTLAPHSHQNAAGGGTLNASAIGAGVFGLARLPTGLTNTTVARGDQTLYALAAPKADGYWCVQTVSGVPTLVPVSSGLCGTGGGGGGGGGISWAAITNSNWTALTNSQWTSLGN